MDNLLIEFSNTENKIASIEEEITKKVGNLLLEKENLQKQSETIKEQIKKAMEDTGTTSYKNEIMSISYVAPGTRNSVDSSKLKENYPDVYQDVLKTTNVNSYIKIKINKIEEQPISEVKDIELKSFF